MNTKQVILLRKDLNMPAGKACSMAAHASLQAILNQMYTDKELIDELDVYAVYRELNTTSNSALNLWITGKQTKITLGVDSLKELDLCYKKAQGFNLPCSYIIDNGLTVFTEPTIVGIAIGPDWAENINQITSHLRLY